MVCIAYALKVTLVLNASISSQPVEPLEPWTGCVPMVQLVRKRKMATLVIVPQQAVLQRLQESTVNTARLQHAMVRTLTQKLTSVRMMVPVRKISPSMGKGKLDFAFSGRLFVSAVMISHKLYFSFYSPLLGQWLSDIQVVIVLTVLVVINASL